MSGPPLFQMAVMSVSLQVLRWKRLTAVVSAIATLGGCLLLGQSASAQQSATAASAAPALSGYVRNWTRVESWNFFEPYPGGGRPTYVDIANRLLLGVRRVTPRYELDGALQYVQFGGLPSNAFGPGPLGVGASYFGHSQRSDSRQLYLRYLSLRLKDVVPGLSAQVGRFGYNGGTEAPSGNSKIEAVKQIAVVGRMIGEFAWSMYQRGYDGVRVDFDRPAWHVSAVASRPTQGGFEDAAGVSMSDVTVLATTFSLRPDRLLPRTDSQLFIYRYRDRREVRSRPDNTGLPAMRADVAVNTFGVTLVGAYPRQSDEIDVLVWLVGQTGSWYGQEHRAYAISTEVGYQWHDVAAQPWVHIGWRRGSGDDNPLDQRHGTFFQMVPTARKYSLSTTYNLMNSVDLFARLALRPRSNLDLRIDVHRVNLASAADRWYTGSGATQERGTIFGFSLRPSNGATGLGTVVEGSASYTVNPSWSVTAYLGVVRGGEVVRRLFAGDRLAFGFIENVFSI